MINYRQILYAYNNKIAFFSDSEEDIGALMSKLSIDETIGADAKSGWSFSCRSLIHLADWLFGSLSG